MTVRDHNLVQRMGQKFHSLHEYKSTELVGFPCTSVSSRFARYDDMAFNTRTKDC